MPFLLVQKEPIKSSGVCSHSFTWPPRCCGDLSVTSLGCSPFRHSSLCDYMSECWRGPWHRLAHFQALQVCLPSQHPAAGQPENPCFDWRSTETTAPRSSPCPGSHGRLVTGPSGAALVTCVLWLFPPWTSESVSALLGAPAPSTWPAAAHR